MKFTLSIIFTVIIFLNGLSQGCFFNGSSQSLGRTTKYSGNPSFDQINNQEYQFLVQKFTVQPDMYYLIDGNQPNAYATSQITNPNLPDGSVYIGFSLIQNECGQSPSGTCSSVPIIMAHEFAHIVDFKYGTGLRGKHKELFADFLAGCYMYYRSVQFRMVFTEEVARSFYNKGDFAFYSQQHHGTPDQRLNCLMAGYNTARSHGNNFTLRDAVQSAIQYVRQF